VQLLWRPRFEPNTSGIESWSVTGSPTCSVEVIKYSFIHSRHLPLQSVGVTCMIEKSVFDSREGQEIFLFSTASRPALRPIQPPTQWVHLETSGLAVKLTTHLHPAPTLRTHGAIPPLSHTSSWCGVSLLYLRHSLPHEGDRGPSCSRSCEPHVSPSATDHCLLTEFDQDTLSHSKNILRNPNKIYTTNKDIKKKGKANPITGRGAP
jgi:hypothetical protein